MLNSVTVEVFIDYELHYVWESVYDEDINMLGS